MTSTTYSGNQRNDSLALVNELINIYKKGDPTGAMVY